MTGMRDDAASATVAPYRAPAWLRGGHAQTIWPSFMRLPAFPMRRERVEIGDGDFWDFDWLATPAAPDAPLVVLFHGLEGSATSHVRARAVRASRRAALAQRRPAFPRLRRRAESAAACVSLGRSRGGRGDDGSDPRAHRRRHRRVRGGRVARRFSALLNWLGRAPARCCLDRAGGGGSVGAARPDRLRATPSGAAPIASTRTSS